MRTICKLNELTYRKEWDTELRKNLGITTDKSLNFPSAKLQDDLIGKKKKTRTIRCYHRKKESQLKSIKNKIRISLKCKSCSIKYDTITELQEHYQRKHEIDNISSDTKQCVYDFVDEDRYSMMINMSELILKPKAKDVNPSKIALLHYDIDNISFKTSRISNLYPTREGIKNETDSKQLFYAKNCNENTYSWHTEEISDNHAIKLKIETAATKNSSNCYSYAKKVIIEESSSLLHRCTKCDLRFKSKDSERLHQVNCLDSWFEIIILSETDETATSQSYWPETDKSSTSQEKSLNFEYERLKKKTLNLIDCSVNLSKDNVLSLCISIPHNTAQFKDNPMKSDIVEEHKRTDLCDKKDQSTQNYSTSDKKFVERLDLTGNRFIDAYSKTFEINSAMYQDALSIYKCKTCGEILSNEKIFKKHKRNHEPRKFSCSFCAFSTNWMVSLENHERKKHYYDKFAISLY